MSFTVPFYVIQRTPPTKCCISESVGLQVAVARAARGSHPWVEKWWRFESITAHRARSVTVHVHVLVLVLDVFPGPGFGS